MRRLRPRSTATPVPDPAETSQIDRHGGSSAARAPGPRRRYDAGQKPANNRPCEIISASVGVRPWACCRPFLARRFVMVPLWAPSFASGLTPPRRHSRVRTCTPKDAALLTLSDGRGRTCPELAEGLGCTHRNAVRGLPVEVSTPAGTVERNRIQAAPFFTLSEGRGRCRPRQSVRGLPRTQPPTTLPPRCAPYPRRPAFPHAREKERSP